MAASTSVSSASSETITVEEVIKFHQQRLHCMGELGFEMGYPNIEEPFNNFNQDIYSPAEDEQAVISAMQSTTEDLRQLQRQEKLLRKNSSVVAQAESMLNDELKRLGRSARYIAAQSLSKKVKEVTESKHPKLKPNYVSVSVVRPSPGNTSISPANWIGVNLPLEGNVYEVHQVLRSVMKGDCMERCLDTGLNPKVWDEPHLKWKYQLLAANRPQLLEESSAKLETNKDWEALCAALTDENHKPPTAVLVCENSPFNITTKAKEPEVDISESQYDDPVDEDGNPYFSPPIASTERAQAYIRWASNPSAWD